MNWQTIRKVGQWQLLNRASLTLIVIVPIFAAGWTQVASRFGLEGVFPKFPQSMAMLFFAALAVVAARFFFQLGCPDMVATAGQDDYIAAQAADFQRLQTPDPLYTAIEVLEKKNLARDLVEVVRQSLHRWDAEEAQVDLAITNEAARLRQLQASGADAAAVQASQLRLQELREQRRAIKEDYFGTSGTIFMQRVTLIRRAAQQRYGEQACRNKPLAFLTLVLYLAAVILVIWAIVIGALDVARAAGWIGTPATPGGQPTRTSP